MNLIEKRSCFLLEKKWRWSCCFAEIVMKNLPINQFVKNYFCTLCYSSVDKNCVCSKKDCAFFQKTSPQIFFILAKKNFLKVKKLATNVSKELKYTIKEFLEEDILDNLLNMWLRNCLKTHCSRCSTCETYSKYCEEALKEVGLPRGESFNL